MHARNAEDQEPGKQGMNILAGVGYATGLGSFLGQWKQRKLWKILEECLIDKVKLLYYDLQNKSK